LSGIVGCQNDDHCVKQQQAVVLDEFRDPFSINRVTRSHWIWNIRTDVL